VPGTKWVDCARNKMGGLCQEQNGRIVPGTNAANCARHKQGKLCLAPTLFFCEKKENEEVCRM
jgi:hypothetical protein